MKTAAAAAVNSVRDQECGAAPAKTVGKPSQIRQNNESALACADPLWSGVEVRHRRIGAGSEIKKLRDMGTSFANSGVMWKCRCDCWVVGVETCPNCATTWREQQPGAKPAFWARALGGFRRAGRTCQTVGQRIFVLCGACRHMNWYMQSTVRDMRSFQTVCEKCGSATQCEGVAPVLAAHNTRKALRRQAQAAG